MTQVVVGVVVSFKKKKILFFFKINNYPNNYPHTNAWFPNQKHMILQNCVSEAGSCWCETTTTTCPEEVCAVIFLLRGVGLTKGWALKTGNPGFVNLGGPGGPGEPSRRWRVSTPTCV
jgi:hypothetical protein